MAIMDNDWNYGQSESGEKSRKEQRGQVAWEWQRIFEQKYAFLLRKLYL